MKNKIIKLATDLFMKQGYQATSTRQIARELNISQPALYHHYKNKEQIYIEVLRHFSTEIGHDLTLIRSNEEDVSQALKQMSLYLKENHPMNFSMMMHDMNTELSPEIKKEIFFIWKKNYFDQFEKLFEELSPTLKSNFTAHQVSLHFLRAISAYIEDGSEQFSYNDPLKIEDFVEIFLKGINK